MPAPRKISLAQILELLGYLEKHRDIQLGTSIPRGVNKETEHWQKIAKILNSLPGEPKSPARWKGFWNDLKCRCRKKASDGGSLLPHEKQVLILAGKVKKYPVYVVPSENVKVEPKENIMEQKLEDASYGDIDYADNSRFPVSQGHDYISLDPMPTVDTVKTCPSYQEQELELEEEVEQVETDDVERPANEGVPEWVRQVEHSRLGLEERTARAVEQMSAGITAMAEAMRAVVGSLHSIEASIRALNNKS